MKVTEQGRGMVNMPNKLFGYARVSTQDQNLELQLDALQKYGVKTEDIFQEKMSGGKKDRPQLDELLKQLRAARNCFNSSSNCGLSFLPPLIFS